MNRYRYLRHLFRDLLILIGSVIIAFVLTRIGLIENFIELTGGSGMLSSFIAGAFFTSIFTVAPAGVALIAIGGSVSPISVAFFGALGATIVDVLIISFVRRDLTEDLNKLSKMAFRRSLIKIFHFGFFKWVAFIGGLFLIATPLPDEPGLFLIGISKVNFKILPLVFFIGHFLGIWAIVSIALAI